MNLPVYAATTGLAALALTPIVRRLCLRWGLVDIANERSLHEGRVPRAGGIAFVLPFLVAVAVGWLAGDIPRCLAFGFLFGAGGVATVAFSDDVRPRSTWLRLALWSPPLLATLAAFGWMHSMDLGFMRLEWGFAGSLVALTGGIWLVTLYNFMDGINGLAAGQAVIVAGGAAGFLWLAGDPVSATVAASLASASAGFLVWNWWPRTVFMGDVGSTFLGATFAVLSLHTERGGLLPMLTWHILLMPFLVDATFTLIRRVATGRQWRRAHRDHAYQRAVLAGYSHAQVACAIFALDVVLLGIAWWSVHRPTHLLACALGAFALTAACWFATALAWPAPPDPDPAR